MKNLIKDPWYLLFKGRTADEAVASKLHNDSHDYVVTDKTHREDNLWAL